MTKLLKQPAIKHTIEDSAPSTVARDFRMDLVAPAEELQEAAMSDCRRKNLLTDVVYAEP